MQTSLFDFHLPESLIALEPHEPRDASRMLVVTPSDLQDRIISHVTDFLNQGDVLVFNNSKVLPARLLGKKGYAGIELLLHKQQAPGSWQCFARPAKRLKAGDKVYFADDFFCTVAQKNEDGQLLAQFEPEGFYAKLLKYGQMPLPPYIQKKRQANASDVNSYQTIYAKHEGSVAAPTAGLHFTERLLDAIDHTGAKRAYVTLHVGGGTFLPVKAEDTSQHIMHSEWAEVPENTVNMVNRAKTQGGRVIAVGTTSLRTLETATDETGLLRAFAGDTNIFITPGYRFKMVDALLTNFHLPKSTLFMLVSAFSGLDRMKSAYQHAIEKGYRFYSYGDACLLFPKERA